MKWVLRRVRREAALSQWRRWFAWHPVTLTEDGRHLYGAWLEVVARRNVGSYDDKCWEYTTIKKAITQKVGIPPSPKENLS